MVKLRRVERRKIARSASHYEDLLATSTLQALDPQLAAPRSHKVSSGYRYYDREPSESLLVIEPIY
jgi:hypothetical protein